MGIIRPATPGFFITLTATILLAVVSFSVPLFKSIFFLKASYSVQNVNGTISFGTLGYCIEIAAITTCSKPTVGYELDINKLVGNNLPIQIPQVVVKWLTYALVLHIVALGLAGVSAIFGLLAHVREMSMTCCSSCISGFAAAVAALAFIIDVVFFFLAKTRINKVPGGAAVMGNAIWLTLAATVLLFFSGCFYTIGRCCIKRRTKGNGNNGPAGNWNGYAEQMRLDAVKAEADRKANQRQGEVGLPAFREYDAAEPLKSGVTDEGVFLDEEPRVPYRDQNNAGAGAYGGRPSQNGNAYMGGGYVQAAPGTRTVDDYYSPTESRAGSYPPQPHRQPSTRTQSSAYTYTNASTPPPLPASNSNYLTTIPQYGHEQHETSYHSAVSHQQNPTDNAYDLYRNQTPSSPHASNYYTQSPPPAVNYHTQLPAPPAANYYTQSPPPPAANYHTQSPPPSDNYYAQAAPAARVENPYMQPSPAPVDNYYTHTAPAPLADNYYTQSPPPAAPLTETYYTQSPSAPHPNNYYTPAPPIPQSQERSYTLGGDGYGNNVLPTPQDQPSYGQYAPPINTNIQSASGPTSPVRGPRPLRQMSSPYEDNPPVYDDGPSHVVPGGWGSKN